MFLLRTRRPHRYAMPVTLAHAVQPPGCDDDGPDPDDAIGALDFHLEDLEDEAAMPDNDDTVLPAIDGVNFVNFVGDDE
jgi:hypothetical protein